MGRGGADSRRASGLAGALGVGGSGRLRAEAAAGRAGCSGLEIPSTSESQEGTKGSEERGGTLRTPVLVRGIGVPVQGSASAVGQRLAGLTALIQGLVSGRSAAPGPFPATSRACLRHSGSESFPIAFLHVCVSCGDWVRKFGGVLTNSTMTDAGG